MDFKKTFQNALDVVLLKVPMMKELAADKKALKPALYVVGAVSIVAALGLYFFPESFGTYIVYRLDFAAVLGRMIYFFILNVIVLYVVGFLAEQIFNAKFDTSAYVRVMGHGSIVGLLLIFPTLAIFAAIWGLVIMWKVLKELGKMGTASVVILLIIQLVLTSALNNSIYAF